MTRGAQRPRFQRLPAGKVGSSGAEAVELAESAGLILDPWQAWVLEEALAERADGLWSAFECALIVPRQNGKGSVLEALELAALFLFDCRLVVHSAHEFKTAREHFLRMQSLVQASDEIFEQVEYIHTGAGAESIGLRNGARLNFVARSRGSGRGFSGDLIVLDEAFALPIEAVGAMGPALSAMPNPQVWYTSSAPHADSKVLHQLRKRGLSDDPEEDRLFFAEWGNDPGADDDLETIASANPGYGIRLTPENIKAERKMLADLGDEFARERLGIPSEPDEMAGVFPTGTWGACRDETSKISTKPVLVLDVMHGLTFASFGGAGHRPDGLPHIELRERRPATGWVVAWAAAQTHPIWLDARGPAGGLIDDLEKAGVTVLQIPDGLIPQACSKLQNHVVNGTVRHIGQAPLDTAASGAAIKPAGDSWRWSRSASPVDISPLMAVTIALGLLEQGPKAPHFYA